MCNAKWYRRAKSMHISLLLQFFFFFFSNQRKKLMHWFWDGWMDKLVFWKILKNNGRDQDVYPKLTIGGHIGRPASLVMLILVGSEVAQIQLDLIFLRKSTQLLPSIKILHLSANFDKTLGNETSTVDLHFVQVTLRSDIRWKTFINGESRMDFLRKCM